MTYRFALTAPIPKASLSLQVRIIPGTRPVDDGSTYDGQVSRSIAEAGAISEGVRRLSPEAFRAVYELHADGLNSFAYSILRDANAAEDAVQQAFLELVKAAPRFRGDERSLQAWLFRSVRYRCLDEIRRRERRPEIPHANVPELTDVTSDTPMAHDLDSALEQLTEQQRSVMFLRHVVGLSGNEVARVLQMNRAAVFATASRAEKRLRSLLESEERTAT